MPSVESLRAQAQATAEVDRGRPADALMELGEQVDLVVIGAHALESSNPGAGGQHGRSAAPRRGVPGRRGATPGGRQWMSSGLAGFSGRLRNRRACPAQSPF